MAVKKRRMVDKVINSYLLANQDQPYKRLKLLQKYLRARKIARLDLKTLRSKVKKHRFKTKNQEKIDKIEAMLFTKDGEPKKNRYGSAFCDNCYMYKDYEKECPYCGSLEMSL